MAVQKFYADQFFSLKEDFPHFDLLIEVLRESEEVDLTVVEACGNELTYEDKERVRTAA